MKTFVSQSFNQSAVDYDAFAKIQQEIGHRLFARLAYFKIQPTTILDLGCGTGTFSRELKKRYPKALIVGLDLASNMLLEAKKKQGFLRKWPLVLADMLALPLATNAFDLIFANQVVHWSSSWTAVLSELNRVLAKDGCLLFSTLGPDTFKELRQAFGMADTHTHTNTFSDMHEVGDQLVNHYFVDPVVDMEFIKVCYKDLDLLLTDLKKQGVKNLHPDRNKGLTGKKSWSTFKNAYQSFQTPEGKYPLTYEVIYAQAFKGQKTLNQGAVETHIPLSHFYHKSP